MRASPLRLLAAAVVLPVALSVALASAAFGGSGPETIRVVTFNAGLLRLAGRYDQVPAVAARAAKLPSALARLAVARKIDLLALQEVWERDHVEAIRSALERVGYDVYVPRFPGWVDHLQGKVMSSGLLLAARRPVPGRAGGVRFWGTPRFEPFEHASRVQSLAAKGIVSAWMETARGRSFLFVTTHTQNIDNDDGSAADPALKTILFRQLAQFQSLVAADSRGGEWPVLAAADFNVGPEMGADLYRILTRALRLRDAASTAPRGRRGITWDPRNPNVSGGKFPASPAQTIDHVLYRDGVIQREVFGHWTPVSTAVLLQGADTLSDHYAVEAVLKFED